jgi:hypothetical protein
VSTPHARALSSRKSRRCGGRLPSSKRGVSILQLWCTLNVCMSIVDLHRINDVALTCYFSYFSSPRTGAPKRLAIFGSASTRVAQGRLWNLRSGAVRVRLGSIATKIDHSGHFRLSLNSGSTEDIAVGPVRANARNRCAIARCAGSPTASAVTGGKIVKTR